MLRAVLIAGVVGSFAVINLYVAQQMVGSFCLQTTGTALQLVICISVYMQWLFVSSLLELNCSIT
jgi:hypothetical protein